jgi:ligand-binding sensor domain-containing protein
MTTRYNHTNSSLSTIFPGNASQYNYVRVGGLDFDAAGNLWMTNSGVSDVIVVRKADGSWTSLSYPVIASPSMADKILVASNGIKWINLVRADKAGIFALNDKGTIDDISDDTYHYYSSLTDNASGANIDAGEFICLAEDRNGAIWIGTNRGPVYVSTPSRGPEGTMTCSRIIYTNEFGEADYFLKDERINSIAVDGGNRKWIATDNSGLYLVSPDGTEVVRHFTSANSPLISNSVKSLAVDNGTGEVFIGTDKGLQSYMSDAAAGADSYSNVYAYPNPVRPEYDGSVIITGLMDNSGVKITDARGLLVYEGVSNGGMFTWNCRRHNGQPVAPGIYFVIAATPEGKESTVSKIAVVR